MDGNAGSENFGQQDGSSIDISKKQVHVFSHSLSTASDRELISNTSASPSRDIFKNSVFRSVSHKTSSRVALALVLVLLIGLLTMTTLFVLEYNKERMLKNALSNATLHSQERTVKCLEHTPDITLKSMPTEVKTALSELEKDIKLKLQTFRVKAASFGLVYNGKLWWTFHAGKMNYSNPNSPTPNNDTPYPIASVTKLFTAVMLHRLVKEGKIKSIDDPIKAYNDRFSIRNPFNSEDITFRQLACMTSSLPREAPCHPQQAYNLCPYNNTEMWRRISDVSLTMRPNLLFSYSNLGYGILGRTMENITKQASYEAWVKREILDPLGMRNSGFDIRRRSSQMPLSKNADQTESRVLDWGWLNPAAGLYSTITDLCKFVSALMESSKSKILSLSTRRELFRISRLYQQNSQPVAYGCPFILSKTQTMQKDISTKVKKQIYQTLYERNGNTPGYYSNIVISPDLKLATIAITAKGGNEGKHFLGNIVASRIVPIVDRIIRRNQTMYKLPKNPVSYVGNYRIDSYWPMVSTLAKVTKENGKLFIHIEGFKTSLTYVRPWVLKTFYTENERCRDALASTGLFNNLYHFEKPSSGTNLCQRFHVDGISASGYLAFKRV